MQLNSALGALGIAAASAVVVFAVHRMATSGGSMSEPRSTLISQTDIQAPPAMTPPAMAGQPVEGEPAQPADDAAVAAAAERGADAALTVDPHIEALRHPSPVYRNVSLATVIRNAGHQCVEILSSAAGDDELGAWRVACDGGHAYFVSPDEAGGLQVEPMPYFEMPFRPLLQEFPDQGLRLVPPRE